MGEHACTYASVCPQRDTEPADLRQGRTFPSDAQAISGEQPRAATIEELQSQIDRFTLYDNEVRPHRARDRLTPRAAFDARDKATPRGPKIGRAFKGTQVIVLVSGLDIRVLTEDGELLRQLTLDPSKDYQRQGSG